MCGLVSILNLDASQCGGVDLRKRALAMAKAVRHRGPDWSGVYSDDRAIIAHERLSIVGVKSGAQPLVNSRTGAVLGVNGEIYNYSALRQQLHADHPFQTSSDCEVILYLYEEFEPADFLNRLNGIFAFVLWDPRRDSYLIARDPIGVVPLYVGWDGQGRLCAASEMKALVPYCERIEEFPPGTFYSSNETERAFQPYYRPRWMERDFIPAEPYEPSRLREALEAAVDRQLMSDVPYGTLISGGVDSSIIAAIAERSRAERLRRGGPSPMQWPLNTPSFSIGLLGAPDLQPARKAAEHIGTIHHEVNFTVQEGLDALTDVVYYLETFDVTTIRAATPMYLLMRRIRAEGIKMVLSGEGADEVFGGYLYFHKAPNGEQLHRETVRKLRALHLYDCLRANKCAAAWGVETRVPFLDRDFLEVAMMLEPSRKLPRQSSGERCIEKWALRTAFEGYLPPEVVWRQKEQFSDGVGYRWIQGLKMFAEQEVSNDQLQNAKDRFPVKTPRTKEEYLYRNLFEQHYPRPSCVACVPQERSVACSTAAALEWDQSLASMIDPSGRAVLDVHSHAYSGGRE